MAIFHLHAQIIKRSSGRSSIAASAYRAGEKLYSNYDGMTHDYTRKSGVVHTEIVLSENAPKEYSDRSTLWNAVEKVENRKDAQTAREIDVALPVELDREEQIQLIRKYVQENFVDKGMCADFAIHDKQDGNPHAHIMLTTREVSADGFGGKNRDWNKRELLEQWRENWADTCNERLQSKGTDERIDHRTLKAQGIDREPTIHIGATAQAMEKAGCDSERIREYREITAKNKSVTPDETAEYMHELKQGYIILDKEITSIKQKNAVTQQEIQSLKFRTEKIDERAKHINAMREQIAELKAKRQVKGFFMSKKAIDEQIQALERLHEQANTAFKKEFNVLPIQATMEIKQLECKAKDFEQTKEQLQGKLTPLTAEKDIFAFEYQRQKLLMEISPSSQKIQDEFTRLENITVQKLSVHEKLAYTRIGRTIDMINERSFQRILDDLQPEQAYKLIKLYERERVSEHIRLR